MLRCLKTYRPVLGLLIHPPPVASASSSSLIFSLLCVLFSVCHLGVVHIHLFSHYFCIFTWLEKLKGWWWWWGGAAAAALNRRVPTRHPAGSSQPLLSKATHVGPRRPLVLEPSSDGAALAVLPSVSLRAPRALSSITANSERLALTGPESHLGRRKCRCGFERVSSAAAPPQPHRLQMTPPGQRCAVLSVTLWLRFWTDGGSGDASFILI